MSRIRKLYGLNLQQNADQVVSLAQEARLRYLGGERLQVSFDTRPYKDIGGGGVGGQGTPYHLPRWDATGKALEDSRVVDNNVASGVIAVGNAGFETPVVPVEGYVFNPAGASWAFSALSGIIKGSFSAGASPAPEGAQNAFLQENGTISQALTGFVAGQTYQLSFKTAQQFSSHDQDFSVSMGALPLGTIKPASDIFELRVIQFVAATTAYTLTFQGLNSSAQAGNTVYIDDVHVVIPTNPYVRIIGGGLQVEPLGDTAQFVGKGGSGTIALLNATGNAGWLLGQGTFGNTPTPPMGVFNFYQGVNPAGSTGTVLQLRENFNTYLAGPIQLRTIRQGFVGYAPWPGPEPDFECTALYFDSDTQRTYLYDGSIPFPGEVRQFRPIPRYEGHHIQAVVQESGGLPATASPRFTLYGSTYGGSTDSAQFGWTRYGSDNNNFKIWATEGTFGSTSDTNVWVNYYASWLYGTWQARFQAAIGGTTASQAGLIIRDPISFNGDTWYFYVGVQYQAQKVWFSYRQFAGDPATAINVDVGTNAPIWLRLVTTATQIEAYYSLDGSNWVLVGVKPWFIVFPIIYGWTIVPNAPAALPPPEAYFEDFRFPGVTAAIAGPAIVTTYAQREFLRFTGTGIQGIADDAANNATTVTVARGAGLTVIGEAQGVAATRGFIRLRGANWTVTDDIPNNTVILEVGGGTGADGGDGRAGYFPVFVGSPTGPLADSSHLAEDTTNKRLAFNEIPTAEGNLHAFLVRPNADDNGVVVFPKAASTGSPFAYQDYAGAHKFQVDYTGNIAFIKNIAYTWPDAVVAGGALVTNASGVLSWVPAGTGTVGPGTVNTLSKFTGTPPTPSSVIGDSGITDDGAVVQVAAHRLVLKQTDPTLDLSEMAFAIPKTMPTPTPYAIWRYMHDAAGLADPIGNPDGQMELFLNNTEPCIFLGKGTSWFECGVRIRPPSAFAGSAFETQTEPSGAVKFQIAAGDGNVSVLRGVPYSWPTAGPSLVDQVLTYDGTNLIWKKVVIPTGLAGRTGYFPVFGPSSGPLADLSHLVEDVTNFHLAYNEVPTALHAFLIRPNANDNGVVVVPVSGTSSGSPFASQDTGGGSKFQVDSTGNLLYIHNVQYQWPGTAVPPDSGVKILQYDPATFALTWINPPTPTAPGVSGGGTINTVPKFSITGTPGTIANSHITDDGNLVQSESNFVAFKHPTADTMDVLWRGAGGAASQAVVRYEHSIAGNANADPLNTAGEFELYMNSSSAFALLGPVRSSFLSALRVRPPTGYVGASFETLAIGGTATQFSVSAADGNLSVLRQVAYNWPQVGQTPAPTGTWCVLGYSNNASPIALQWLQLPSAGTGDITGSGTAATLAMFNAAKNIVNSQITDTTIGGSPSYLLTGRDLVVRRGSDVDLAQFILQTDPVAFTPGSYGLWRYEHRTGNYAYPANSTSGEMQLFLNNTLGGAPSFQVGSATANFAGALTIQGNLARINTVDYIWPTQKATANDYYLAMSNIANGQLTWKQLPTGGLGNVTVANPPADQPIGWVPRWNGKANLLEKSAIQDRTYPAGTDSLGNPYAAGNGTVEIDCVQLLFKRIDTLDISDFYMRTGASPNWSAVWRYDHRAYVGGPPNSITDAINTDGEVQLFMNAGGALVNPVVALGSHHSWFAGGVRIRATDTNYTTVGNALEIRTRGTTDSPAFYVDQNGNPIVVNRINYNWPAPPLFTGAARWMQCDASGNLTWQPPPTGSGTVSGSGTVGTLPRVLTASPYGVLQDSGVSDDGTTITLNSRRFTVIRPNDFDLSEIRLQTSPGNYGIWRYEHRTSAAGGVIDDVNSLGEMQLFVNSSVECLALGPKRSYFLNALRVKMPDSSDFPFAVVQPGGTAHLMRVDADGNLGVIRNWTYAWPTARPAAATGYFLTSDLSGNLSWAQATGASGANVSLSNLSAVSINANLGFNSDGAWNIGDQTNRVGAIYLKNAFWLYSGGGTGGANGPKTAGFLDSGSSTYTRFLVYGNGNLIQSGDSCRVTHTAYHAIEFRGSRRTQAAPGSVSITAGDPYGVLVWQENDLVPLKVGSQNGIGSDLQQWDNGGNPQAAINAAGTIRCGGIQGRVLHLGPSSGGTYDLSQLNRLDNRLIVCDMGSGSFNVRLPPLSSCDGRSFHIVMKPKTSLNSIFLQVGAAGDDINEAGMYNNYPAASWQLRCSDQQQRYSIVTADYNAGSLPTWRLILSGLSP